MCSKFKLVQNEQRKHQNNALNLFKVNNKDTRMKSLTSLYCYLWTDFIRCSGYFIVDFELINAGWVLTIQDPIFSKVLECDLNVISNAACTFNLLVINHAKESLWKLPYQKHTALNPCYQLPIWFIKHAKNRSDCSI